MAVRCHEKGSLRKQITLIFNVKIKLVQSRCRGWSSIFRMVSQNACEVFENPGLIIQILMRLSRLLQKVVATPVNCIINLDAWVNPVRTEEAHFGSHIFNSFQEFIWEFLFVPKNIFIESTHAIFFT